MATQQCHAITLKGSTDIVADFFGYGINSILYQRGVYPPETFTRKEDYGLTILVTADEELKKYLGKVLADVKEWCKIVQFMGTESAAQKVVQGLLYGEDACRSCGHPWTWFVGWRADWLYKMTVQKLVVVIKSLDDGEVLERWQFNVECDKSAVENKESTKAKDVNAVKKEIQGIIRQITASVTFLPLLEGACSFDILIYTDKDLEIPQTWNETGPALMADSQEVRLRSFSTVIHKVDAMVAYKKVVD